MFGIYSPQFQTITSFSFRIMTPKVFIVVEVWQVQLITALLGPPEMAVAFKRKRTGNGRKQQTVFQLNFLFPKC